MTKSLNAKKKRIAKAIATTFLIFLAGSLAIVPTMNTQKATAAPSLTHTDVVCNEDVNPPGSEVTFNLVGTGYPPDSPLREHTVVEGGGTFDAGATATTDSNGAFNQQYFSSIEPKSLTKTLYVDLNGNNELDSEDAGASTTIVITGNECDVSTPPPEPVTCGDFTFEIKQPINNDGSSIFEPTNKGRTIPVKVTVWDSNGNLVTDQTEINGQLVKLELRTEFIDNDITGDDLSAVSTSSATSGDDFRYVSADGHWIFNLSTDSLQEGTHLLRIFVNCGEHETLLVDPTDDSDTEFISINK